MVSSENTYVETPMKLFISVLCTGCFALFGVYLKVPINTVVFVSATVMYTTPLHEDSR